MLKGEKVYIGSPDSMRDYIYVTDHAEAYILAMNSEINPGEVFNISSEKTIRNRDLTNIIAQLIGFDKDLIQYGTYPPGYPIRPISSDQPAIMLDSLKARNVLGWQSKISLESGLSENIEYWRSHLT